MVGEQRARRRGKWEINGTNSEIDGIKNKINPINFRFNPINFGSSAFLVESFSLGLHNRQQI